MPQLDVEVINAFVDGGGQELVKLFRSPQDGKVRAIRRSAEWSAFLRREDVSPVLMRDLRSSLVVAGVREEGDWLRVSWKSEEARKGWVSHPESPLQKEGVKVYEGDVDPVRRHFTDTDAKIAEHRRCYLDIETDSRVPFDQKDEMRVLTWAVVAHDTGERWSGCLAEWSDKAERRLLVELWDALQPFDQVAAWYGDGFDFPVVFARSAFHKIPQDARKWVWLDQLEAFKRFNMHSAESGEEKRSMKLEDIGQSVTGRGKLKAPAWVVERFGDKSMGALSWDLWEAGGEFRQLLVDYNVQDTTLLRDIERETGYLELFTTLCRVCRLFPSTAGLNPTHQMDGFMLRLGRDRGYRFPTKLYNETVKFKGAFVMQPTSLDAKWREEQGMQDGILRNVHVCDFAAMYPSIILTFNMSPDTKVVGGMVNGPIPEGTCRTPLTGVSFRTDVEGILPFALKELMRLRKHWNDLKDTFPAGTKEWHAADRMSTAYKVAANAFYGVLGSPYSRFFDKQIAESVTQAGVWLLKLTLHEAEQRKFLAVYGDTDSGFVAGVKREEFAAFVQWCNAELYPGALKKQGCRDNHVKLAYEKEFDRIVFTSAKRYAGSLRHRKWTTTCTCTTAKGEPGSLDVKTMTCRDCRVKHDVLPPIRSKPEIKGLEYKRGDVLLMAADMQEVAMDMLVGGLGVAMQWCDGPTTDIERYHAFLSRVRSRVLEEPLGIDDVRLSKALSKPLKEYAAKKKLDGDDAAQPPHVVVAKMLKSRGQDVRQGTRVDYFVADGASSPMRVLSVEDWAGECDRYYLWESLVYPATERLLEAAFPGRGWSEWAKVRPAKPRKGKASDGQADLFGVAQPAKPAVVVPAVPRGRIVRPAAPPAPPSAAKASPRPHAPPGRVEVLVDEQEGGGGPETSLEWLRAALERHPGTVPVDIRVRLRSGAEAVLATPLKVALSDALDAELAIFGVAARHKGSGGDHGTEEAKRAGG